MNRTILIAGKDFPDGKGLASAAVLHGRTTVITASPEADEKTSQDGAVPVVWNRGSALSSRSLVISAMNQDGNFDEAVFVFDEEFFASKYGSLGPAESNRVCDELILSYQYLAGEVLNRFTQKKTDDSERKAGKIAFVYKSNVNQAEIIKNPNLSAQAKCVSKVLVAAAGAAFKAFAENFAAAVSDSPEVIPVLAECDGLNETAKKDSSLMGWLCEYLDQLDTMKKSLTAKQKISWVKAGAKGAAGFNLAFPFKK